jgi:phosphoesterase RecJ-like protein
VVSAVGRSRRPLILGHVRPDGDCLGAIFALGAALESAGDREPCAYYRDDQVSQRLAFLRGMAARPSASVDQRRACDTVIVLDTAQLTRAAADPPLQELLAAGLPVINIDHHVDNPGFGTLNWVVPAASSTCELVYRLLVALKTGISPAIASLLYAGIHSDTLGFSLPNTTAGSLQVAAELVRAGADVADLCEQLCRSQARSEFDLVRLIYANTRLTPDGQIAYSTATYEEIAATGCTAADIDEQVSIPRSLHGIRMAILFTEGKRGRIRINFRGERGTNVLQLAKSLGGGGHNAAAGAIVDGAMEPVVADVLERARRLLASWRVSDRIE